MKNTATPEEIETVLAEALPGVEVVDVEMTGKSGNSTLRVFIDYPGGVDHELCVKVTGLLDRYLQDHAVEVSSPGLERRLRKPEHFRDVVGEKINVKTFGPVQGQRNFTGFLIDVTEKGITVDLGDREAQLAFDEIARARKLFEFPELPETGRKKKGKRQ